MTAIGTLLAGDDPGDRYTQTLDHLEVAARRLHSAVLAHRTTVTIQDTVDHDAALVDLHHQVRTMAVVLNHALGGWPDPPPGEFP